GRLTSDPNVAGLSGARLVAKAGDRLSFGGGGGGGHFNGSSNPPPRGGFGGGLVLIIASRIEGSGAIHANGTAGLQGGDCSNGDGAGGGGAGGTIALAVATSMFAGRIETGGGDGGNVC